MSVAVLFARRDSCYKTIPGCDVWDMERDARRYRGRRPVIAHPPCRAWGKLAHFAKPRPDEMDLARFAVAVIRRRGGVLEHPAGSRLWRDQGLPGPGARDGWGGFTLPVLQWWWGHRAEKATLLYVVGCEPCDVPEIPFRIGYATHVISSGNGLRAGMRAHRPGMSQNNRERTPEAFARWLVELAGRCAVPAKRRESAHAMFKRGRAA